MKDRQQEKRTTRYNKGTRRRQDDHKDNDKNKTTARQSKRQFQDTSQTITGQDNHKHL